MSYDGFLSFGGAEILNAGRTSTYVNNLLPQFGLENCAECDDLRHALGHEEYTSPFVDQPDWFDENNPDSWRFYGLYPVEINGLDDSVRESAVTQLAVDGAVMSAPRQQGREIRVSALLIGADDAAVQYGITWLRYATFGAACREGEGCTGDHLCYFAACPPICEDSPDVTHDGEVRVHNVRTCHEGIITTYERACALPYERNLYQVTVIDGPRIVEQYNTVCGSMVRVEWTMVAGVPWAYSTATFVDESATGDPSTIIPEISCAAGSTSVVRRNLATNPIPAGTPGVAGWASAEPDRWSVTQDTEVIRLPGDASVRMEVLDNTAEPNLADNPTPETNLDGWVYNLGQGPSDQNRTNLFPNPRVASLTGGQFIPGNSLPVTATNLWPLNPGLQVDATGWDTTVSGPGTGPVLATNLATDPRATTNVTWSQTLRWFGSGATGTRSLVTGIVGPAGTGITTAARKAWTTAPTGTNGDTGFQLTPSTTVQRWTVTPDTTYYAAAFLRLNSEGTGQKTGVARIVFYDADGAAVGGSTVAQTGGALVAFTPADGWVRVEHTRTAPTGAATAMVLIDITDGPGDVVWAAGDQLDGTGAMWVASPAQTPIPYFDGATAPTESMYYAWTGAVNASTSTAKAAPGVTVIHHDPTQEGVPNYQTARGSGYLTKRFDAPATAVQGNGVRLGPIPVAGLPASVRFMMAVRGPSGHSAMLAAVWMDAAGREVARTTGAAINFSGGWTRSIVSLVGAIPAGATQVSLWLTLSAASGTIAMGTEFAFSEARASSTNPGTANPWFDGSSPDIPAALLFTWDGEPHASTSTRTRVADPSGTLTVESGPGPGGVAGFLRATVVTPAVNGSLTYNVVLPGDGQVVAGRTYSFSMWVRSSARLTQLTGYTTKTGVDSLAITVSDVTLEPGVWTRITGTAIAYAGTPGTNQFAAGLQGTVSASGNLLQAGDTLDLAQIMLQEGDVVGSFFDGAFVDAPGLDYAWTGEPNASSSTLTVSQPQVTTTLETGPGPDGDPGFMRNVIVVPKAGGYSGPSYTQDITVPAGGAQYTAQVWVRSTVGGQAPFRVQALNATGDVLANVVAAPIPVAANTWTLFGPLTVDAPPGTTQIRIWPQTTGDQILPAGTAVDMAQVTLVEGWSMVSPVMGHLTYAGQHTLDRVIALMPTVLYTASVYVATSRTAYARLDVTFYNATGGILARFLGPSEHVAGQFQPTPARMWTRIEHTFTAPPGTATATFEVFVTRAPDGYAAVGDLVWFTNMLVERSSVAQAYFDGTFADTPTLNYAWTGAVNASISTVSQVIPLAPGPILDPDCAVVPSAPRPPALEIACLDTPFAWRRYTALVPDDVVPVWRDAVPIVDIQTQGTAARQVRVRFYPNPFANPPETLDPCDFCGEFVISYIPPYSVLTIDGIRQQAFVTGPTGAQQVANHLLYASDGGPMQWPLLSCGVTYTAVIDVAPEGVVDLSAKLCLAARE